MVDVNQIKDELLLKEISTTEAIAYMQELLTKSGVMLTGKESAKDLASGYYQLTSKIEADWLQDKVDREGSGILKMVGTPEYEAILENYMTEYHKNLGVRMLSETQNFIGGGALLRGIKKVGVMAINKANEKRAEQGKPSIGSKVLGNVSPKIREAIGAKFEIITKSEEMPSTLASENQKPLNQVLSKIRAGRPQEAQEQLSTLVKAESNEKGTLFENLRDVLNAKVEEYKDKETKVAIAENSPYVMLAVAVFVAMLVYIIVKK